MTGYLIKDTAPQARGEAFVTYPFLTRRVACSLAAGVALTRAAAVSPSQAAAKIQHLISPGGIEAWFVQDATVPLIAMEYAFAGGAAQDPADKPGVGNMVGDLLDEGSGDLDSKTFHERLDRRAIELSFSVHARYVPRHPCACCSDNKDEAFDLLRMRADLAAFRHRRRRAHPLAGACRACAATPPTRPRWRAANSWRSPSAIIPMAGSPTARWRACRPSRSPT